MKPTDDNHGSHHLGAASGADDLVVRLVDYGDPLVSIQALLGVSDRRHRCSLQDSRQRLSGVCT